VRRRTGGWAEAMIIAFGILALVSVIGLVGIGLLQAARASNSTPQPQQVSDHRPDISHCFQPEETRELWDCIRHEED